MILTALIAALATSVPEPVELYRQWEAGDKFEYSVSSRLQRESRDLINTVFIPVIDKAKYNFTLEVSEVSDEGFATANYKKPTVVVTIPETDRKKAYDEIEEVNEHLLLSISPVNAITDFKDLTPKKEDDDDGDGDGGGLVQLPVNFIAPGQPQQAYSRVFGAIQNAIDDFFRVANFSGSVDTMLDFAPRLSLFEVEPGETWEHTAAYQPQVLEGKEGKMAPQRIDYTMTYVGVVEVDGKKVHRVTSDLNLDTDIAPFINSIVGMNSEQSGIRGFKITLTAHIDFDLDLETKHTLRAIGRSQGHIAIEATIFKDKPAQELKVTGRTILKLVPGAKS